MRSLRGRITWGLVAYAALLSAVLAAAAVALNERYERHVWQALLTDVMDRDLRAAGYPGAPPQSTVRLVDLDGPAAEDLPAAVRRLRPGLHDDIEPGGLPYAVLVRQVDGRRIAALVDIRVQQAIERRTAWIAMLGIALGLMVLGGLTRLYAERLLAPVEALVRQVRRLRPDTRQSRVSSGRTEQEITAIEEALNGFLERLDGFVLREREFIDTASHELRTPVAVVAGAAQVLTSERLSETGARALARIRATASDMDAMLTALLQLAREPGIAAEARPLAVHELLAEVLADHKSLQEPQGPHFELGTIEPTWVTAPPIVARMIIGNLVRNALQHTPSGSVRIELVNRRLEILTQHPALDAGTVARLYRERALSGRAHGGGIGLYLIGRLSATASWRLEYDEPESGALIACLALSADK